MMKTNIMLPVVIAAIFSLASGWFATHSPDSKRRPNPKVSQLSVETQVITPAPFAVKVASFGSVKPRIEGELVSQVAGKVTFISDSFRDGGYFQQNQLLLKIDPSEYELQVRIAESELNTAKQALIEEKARADVAKLEWERSGKRSSSASALALRKPQLETAKAAIHSAEARLEMARLNLSRTQIRAPYRGRIRKKHVEIGQVVASGSKLAELFATDYMEIRLPIKNKDLPFLDLPENASQQDNLATVRFFSDLLQKNQSWEGKLIRTESAIDDATQQLHVIAQIGDPYKNINSKNPPLKIGEYLTARIDGRTIENAIVIPNKSIYQGSYVYLVKDNTVQRHDISILWQDDQQTLVGSGLAMNDELVITPIGQVISGTAVDVTARNGVPVQSEKRFSKKQKPMQAASGRSQE